MATTAERLADATQEAGSRADEAIRRKARQLQRFVDDVEDLLKEVSEDGVDHPRISKLRSRVEDSVDRVRSIARDGARTAMDGARSAVDNTRKAAEATDKFAHDRPWVMIGTTAVAGILLGAVLTRSRH